VCDLFGKKNPDHLIHDEYLEECKRHRRKYIGRVIGVVLAMILAHYLWGLT